MLSSPLSPFKNSFIKSIFSAALLTVLVAGVVVLQRQRLFQMQDSSITPANLQQQSDATASALNAIQRLPVFGFDNLVANWFFLQFLQYFGDTDARQATGYSLSSDFFKIIIPNDPYYRLFYIFLSGSTSNFAAQPESSINLISQGLEQLTPTTPPDSFYVWRYKAVDELLFLGNSEAAQQSFQTAADWARQSSHPDAAIMGESSQRTANFLAANPSSRPAQISAWASVLSNAIDEGTRLKAIEHIEALGGTVTIDESGRASIKSPTEN